jgi:pyridoxal phosphate enzyme (YggS family)
MESVEPGMSPAAGRLAAIDAAMARAARSAGRARSEIELVAVSKTWDAAAIAPLVAAGQRSFGENRIAEAQEKWPAMIAATPGIRMHLVGQLQSNKVAEAVTLFDVIHSVDRPSLVAALGKAVAAQGKQPECLIQVNIGAEPQKGGVAIPETAALLAMARDAGLNVTGLMCVPPADIEPAPFFALLQKMARELSLAELSMGMSGDFETAIMMGATMVRIGSALFGERPTFTEPTG